MPAGHAPSLHEDVGHGRNALPHADNHGPNERIDAPDAVPITSPGGQSRVEEGPVVLQRIATLAELAGGIAHDFGNILAIIGSALRLAERNLKDPGKARTYLVGARDGVDRGVQLIAQILAIAKQHELKTRPENANDLLKNLEAFLRYGAGPGVDIVLELASDIPHCLVDASQFNAAVLNLVVNARDAMPDGGEVRISTERWEAKTASPGSPARGVYVRVRVQDSGQGIPADAMGKVFDPLFTTKGDQGTGLGLPQVRAFMQRLGGYISVSSDVGAGTTFDLLFPQSKTTPIGNDDSRGANRERARG